MRPLAYAFAVLLVSGWACSGDSSSPMSVWNDGGPGGARGGQGGQTVSSTGGSGGAASGIITVKGGTRDLATAMCTSASPGGCAVDSANLACVESRCATELVTCYYSDGVAVAAGGKCQAYANCMLACSCDSGQNACQQKCLEDYALTNTNCWMCLSNLFSCMSTNGCVLPTTCASSSAGP